MRDYTLGLPVDDGILALNLTEVAEAEIDMNTVGQLVTSKSAIFASSDGGLFLVTFGASLTGYCYQGQEVYLDNQKVSPGDSMVRLELPAPFDQNRNSDAVQGRDAPPSGMIPFERTQARVSRVFRLKDQEHAQEVADALGR